MNEMTPGAGTATEVWVWAPDGVATSEVTRGLQGSPFDQLAVALRHTEEQSLRSDPVALTSSRLLLGTALVGLLVGGLCVVLMVLAERRESAGELFAREADGTRPARLRVELLARAGAVLAVGVPVGVVAGIALARATTTLITVTAGGTTPEPPLVDAASPSLVAAALAALLGLGLLGAAAVAAGSLRGPLPVPPGTDLR
jgi:ABC-type antimicrobial peptide transport system permease subunit